MGCCSTKEQGEPARWKTRAEARAELQAAELAKRAALAEKMAALPEHLRLGVTLAGMRELLSKLPSDALEQVNANIPLDKKGEPKYPKNDAENGYVNQYFLALWEAMDGLAVCERLHTQGSSHVGKATVFVSWFLDTPIETLLDALDQFLKQKGLRAEDTFFWVCDYVIRQNDVKNDLVFLGDCVSAIGHTVLLMEPWHDPQPLKRAYCIKEVYHTQASGLEFDVVMSTKQQAAFEAALVEDFGSIKAGMCKVDVRNAKCRNPKETESILDELDGKVGLAECNKLVIGLLNKNLAAHARAALALLPAAERRVSTLIDALALLLRDMGQYKEARLLLKEAIQEKREKLGDRHPDTLSSIHNLGWLLTNEMHQYRKAKPLLDEVVRTRRETLGDRHPDTLLSIGSLGSLLMNMDQLEEARLLLEEAVQAQRETLGNRSEDTLESISRMGLLLQKMGQLKEARPHLEEALQGQRETLGNRHMETVNSIHHMASLLHEMGQLEEARLLFEEDLQACRETLGDRHPRTLLTFKALSILIDGPCSCCWPLLMGMGKIVEAIRLFAEHLGR